MTWWTRVWRSPWWAYAAGRTGHARLFCWACGHQEAVFEVLAHGPAWVCPDCRRWHLARVVVSRAVRR